MLFEDLTPSRKERRRKEGRQEETVREKAEVQRRGTE